MSGVATAIVGAAVVGGVVASSSAKKSASAARDAASTSAEASGYAADIQKEMYDITRKDQEPWRTAGVNALGQLTAGTGPGGEFLRPFGMADYTADPGYNFRLSEGIKNMDRSAAASGRLLSGAQLKAVNRFNQDYASNEYQNAYNRYQSNQANQFNRLASISGLGQTANNALQQAGTNYASNVGNITMGNAANVANAQLAAGQASASAYQGYGNALSGLGRNLGSYYSPPPSTSGGFNYQPTNYGGSGSDWDYGAAQSNVDFYGGN